MGTVRLCLVLGLYEADSIFAAEPLDKNQLVELARARSYTLIGRFKACAAVLETHLFELCGDGFEMKEARQPVLYLVYLSR